MLNMILLQCPEGCGSSGRVWDETCQVEIKYDVKDTIYIPSVMEMSTDANDTEVSDNMEKK